jgi:hypothetical protein
MPSGITLCLIQRHYRILARNRTNSPLTLTASSLDVTVPFWKTFQGSSSGISSSPADEDRRGQAECRRSSLIFAILHGVDNSSNGFLSSVLLQPAFYPRNTSTDTRWVYFENLLRYRLNSLLISEFRRTEAISRSSKARLMPRKAAPTKSTHYFK